MKRNSKSNEPKQIFALNVIGYEGAEADFRFAFTAMSEEEAKGKASRWARYQGFVRSDYTVTVATADQSQYIRDEYMTH